jgi:hypothetical protein
MPVNKVYRSIERRKTYVFSIRRADRLVNNAGKKNAVFSCFIEVVNEAS